MGVPTKKTPYEVSEASDVVITMLPSSAHVSIFISSGGARQKSLGWPPSK